MFITHYGLASRRATHLLILAAFAMFAVGDAHAQQVGPQPVVHKVQGASERLNMIANSSRILVLEQRIPQAQVNNPEIVEVTPLSPDQLQVYAKRAGVTQINLWNESQQIYTIEVIVDADARELTAQLARQFPNAALKVIPFPNSVMVTGYVDDPRDVSLIIAIAQQYHPQVIDNIRVGGVQQVMLKVQVMEVSRSKLRTLGIDFGELAAQSGSFVGSNTSGMLRPNGLLPTNQVVTSALTGQPTGVVQVPGAIASSGGQNFSFGIIDSQQAFIGFLEALRQDDLAKILAEPILVTNSGRPAFFNSGGEFPILVPQSLGTVSIQYKPYGTQVDFVPIVLGNGWIRLEVKPRVSEIDPSRSVIINNVNVPALRVREIDTGVEMRPGQTLAIAGLVQNRTDAQRRGLPFFSDLPYIGPLFSRTHETSNEVELLILVTPNICEAMDPNQVPPCGPGMDTQSPTDLQLHMKMHIEVPKLVPPMDGNGTGSLPANMMPLGEPVAPPPADGQMVPDANQPMPPGPPMSQMQPMTSSPPMIQAQPAIQSQPSVQTPMMQSQPTQVSPPAASSEPPLPPDPKREEKQSNLPRLAPPQQRAAFAPSANPTIVGQSPVAPTAVMSITANPSQSPQPAPPAQSVMVMPQASAPVAAPAPAASRQLIALPPVIAPPVAAAPVAAPPARPSFVGPVTPVSPTPNPVRLATLPAVEADGRASRTIVASGTTATTGTPNVAAPSSPMNSVSAPVVGSIRVGGPAPSVQIRMAVPASGDALKAGSLPGLQGSVGYDEIK